MIPPVAPSVLASNPTFEKVHQHLTKQVLNINASTRSINASHEAVAAQLSARRVEEAEDRILSASLLESHHSAELPLEAHELILVIFSYISDTGQLGLTEEEHSLMKRDADDFRSRIGDIANAVSQHLTSEYETLASIASTSCETTSAQRRLPDLPDLKILVHSLRSEIQYHRKKALPSAQYDAINALIALLNSQAQHLQQLIHHLEQRKHGAEARHLIARAQFLSTVAQGLESKSQATYLEHRRDVYTPKLRQELAEQIYQLEEEEQIIAQRRQNVEAAIHECEVVGGDVMKTLGKRYGEIEKEIEEIKRDMELLGKQRGREEAMTRSVASFNVHRLSQRILSTQTVSPSRSPMSLSHLPAATAITPYKAPSNP